MKIRFGNQNDLKSILGIYSEWSKFDGILPSELIISVNESELKNDFLNSHKKYVVAEINGELVGVCYIDTSFISLKSIRLGNMIVKENFRKMGVASNLLIFIQNFARENSLNKIWLWTQEELFGAIKLYEKHGFKLEGIQKSQFCGKDALLYGLVL